MNPVPTPLPAIPCVACHSDRLTLPNRPAGVIPHPSPNQPHTEAHSVPRGTHQTHQTHNESRTPMASIQIKSEYQPVCSCWNTYGEPFDNESEAMLFIREFPLCSTCEADQ